MNAPSPALRPQILAFYAALRDNHVESLVSMRQSGFPLEWAQSFAETSLPEYAMRHGSIEASWWLMSEGIQPENWSSFTGDAWKTFLRHGWKMVTNKEGPAIPLEAYKAILTAGMKKTGESLPGYLDGIFSQSAKNIQTAAQTIFGRLASATYDYLDKINKEAQETIQNATEVSPRNGNKEVDAEVSLSASTIKKKASRTRATKNKPSKKVKPDQSGAPKKVAGKKSGP